MSNQHDESRDFSNEQDMPVEAKEHPALGPTERSQDVESLPRHIVPMGAYNDPNNPVAVSGSVNLSVNDHPVAHAEDYGATPWDEYGHDHVENTMSEGARGLQQFDTSGGAPENVEERAEWKKADWQNLAKSYGLATSGNIDAIKERVEEHERVSSMSEEDMKAEEVAGWNASDWKAEIDGVSSTEDLDELEGLYKDSGAEYSTVESAFDAKREELGNSES